MSPAPQLVIDLDLDLFVCPPVESGGDRYERADSTKHTAIHRALIEFFYDQQLKLKPSTRTKGEIFDFHKESYTWWRRLISTGELIIPFEVVHVDAHDDLLTGLELVEFFEQWTKTEDKINALPKGLSSGNYLGFAVANGWLSKLTWVRRTEPTTQLSAWIFKDFYPASGILQTKRFPSGGVLAAASLLSDGRIPQSFTKDVEIPFSQVAFTHYEIQRPADYVFVARSPGFTPIESDENEGLIRERIASINTTYFQPWSD